MQISQIKYAIKIIEEKNFTKAAEQLYIAQSSLSQQIKELEKSLNVRLIKRTTRSFEVTQAGRSFYEKAKKIISMLDDLENSMKKFNTLNKKLLKIGILPTLSKMGFTAKIAQFMETNKDIDIEFIEDYSEHLLNHILNKKIDIALINRIAFINKAEVELLDYNNLLEDRVVVVAPKNKLVNINSINIKNTIKEPIIKLPEHSSITKLLKAEFIKLNLSPNYVYECMNISTLIDMVGEGLGITFLTSNVAKQYLTKKTHIVKLTPKIINKTALVTLKSVKDSPILNKFYFELIK